MAVSPEDPAPAEPDPAEQDPAEQDPAEQGPADPEPGDVGPEEPVVGAADPVRPVALRPRSRRDRHGRGLRGPLVPGSLPSARTRGGSFDESVVDAAARLRSRLPDRVEHVQFSVEDIPPPSVTDALVPGEPVPLGSGIPADVTGPARVVVYRRTVELRAGGGAEAAELVYDVLLEQVADLLGMLPEDIDPDYGEEQG